QRRCNRSFDKNFSRTTPCVSIFRQINFCESSVTISEGTNALDRVESNVRNVLCPQPFQEQPALKRDRQCAKLCDGEVRICRITELALDPVLFICSDHCCSPNVLPDIAAKRFLQIGNNSMSDAVAKRREILVCSIFANSQSVIADVIVDLIAPDAKKRPHDC